MDPDKPPLLVRESESFKFTQPNGVTRNVGYHVDDMTTGKKGFLRYTPLFRKHNSYALTCDLLKEINDDIELIYVIDKDSRELFRFTVEDFVKAPLIRDNRQDQYAPNRDQHRGRWKNGDQYVVVEGEEEDE